MFVINLMLACFSTDYVDFGESKFKGFIEQCRKGYLKLNKEICHGFKSITHVNNDLLGIGKYNLSFK